jgi:hypothetical protein
VMGEARKDINETVHPRISRVYYASCSYREKKGARETSLASPW